MSIQFINHSTVVSAEALAAFLVAVNDQLDTEFALAWGKPHFVGTCTILDLPGPDDPQGAPGYHDIDSSFVPYARVFAKLAENNKIPWTVVASHELLEMHHNSLVNRVALLDTSGGAGRSGWIIPEEICDAVERQSYSGKGGVPLSNFVLPGWYLQGYKGPVDYLKKLPGPLQLAHGGYADADFFQAQGYQSFSAFMMKKRKVHFL